MRCGCLAWLRAKAALMRVERWGEEAREVEEEMVVLVELVGGGFVDGISGRFSSLGDSGSEGDIREAMFELSSKRTKMVLITMGSGGIQNDGRIWTEACAASLCDIGRFMAWIALEVLVFGLGIQYCNA